MATTKLGNTKQASRAINYAEKRAVEKSGLNCDVNYAKSSFKATRELYGKNDGVQAHTIIQSFKPGEVDEKKCNALGLELAQRIAPNHQVAIYTHNDKEHMHNHIVINAVNLETGQKYQSNKKQRDLVKQKNDEICRKYGLSIPLKNSAIRYTQSEKAVLEKGQSSWKDELRKAISFSKGQNIDFESFQEHLGTLGIKTKKRGSTVSYLHPDNKKWVRGKKLGSEYELEGLENEFARQIESRTAKSEWNELERSTEEQRNRRTEQEARLAAEEEKRRRLRERYAREEYERAKRASTKSRARDRNHDFEME